VTVEVSYPTLVQAQQVLVRQQGHAEAIGRYLRAEGGIHDDTGVLLAMLAPPALAVLEAGTRAAELTGQVTAHAAVTVGRCVEAYVDADRSAYEEQARLAARLGATMAAWSNPADGVPDVGPPAGGAPDGFGDPAQWFSGKVAEDMLRAGLSPSPLRPLAVAAAAGRGVVDAVGPGAGQLVDAGRGLVGDVAGWAGPAGAVQETADPRSYLVTPDLGVNEVQELRWSAGVVLGGIDWVAEQLVGFSILEEVVFKPFGGDFQDIKRAAAAWSGTGQAFTAIAENLAGLTSPTTSGWQGEAGDAFRGAMVAGSGAFLGASHAAVAISGLATNIAYVSQAACIAIGMLLKKVSEKLIRLAAEAAVPVVGWVAGAAEAVILVQDIISYVRLAYSIIEGVVDAIDGFIGGQQQLFQTLGVLEDLAEYATRAARA
jgi:hypothetical protein